MRLSNENKRGFYECCCKVKSIAMQTKAYREAYGDYERERHIHLA